MSAVISEEHIATSFKAEEYAMQETSVRADGKQSILKMEVTCSSEKSVDLNGLHVVISQNIEFFITTSVRISNSRILLMFEKPSECNRLYV
jgi:hypothetical protein